MEQVSLCFISMDSSRQALQTNGNFFFIIFRIYIFLIIVALGLCMQDGEAFVLNSTHSSWYICLLYSYSSGNNFFIICELNINCAYVSCFNHSDTYLEKESPEQIIAICHEIFSFAFIRCSFLIISFIRGTFFLKYNYI